MDYLSFSCSQESALASKCQFMLAHLLVLLLPNLLDRGWMFLFRLENLACIPQGYFCPALPFTYEMGHDRN